jgi:hypothetical protein
LWRSDCDQIGCRRFFFDGGFNMFRLIKLAFYAMIGYVIYELWQGMHVMEEGGGSGGSQGSRRRSSGGQRGRRQNISGPGQGQSEEVASSGGSTHRQTVGRGVV